MRESGLDPWIAEIAKAAYEADQEGEHPSPYVQILPNRKERRAAAKAERKAKRAEAKARSRDGRYPIVVVDELASWTETNHNTGVLTIGIGDPPEGKPRHSVVGSHGLHPAQDEFLRGGRLTTFTVKR